MPISQYETAKKILHCATGADLSLCKDDNTSLIAMFHENIYGIQHSTASDRMLLQQFRSMKPGTVYEIKGFWSMYNICIRSLQENIYLILGPCRIEAGDETALRERMRREGLEADALTQALHFCLRVPVISYETLHRLGILLAEQLLEIPQPVPYQNVQYKWKPKDQQEILLKSHYGELYKMRQVEQTYADSAAFTEAVKQGNLSLAYAFSGKMQKTVAEMTRNPNPVRNAQNFCIVLNTQLRRAMEECNVHPYRLDQISGEIASDIEKMRTVKATEHLMQEVIRKYCDLAREQHYKDQSPMIRLAVTYAKEHLSDNLTVRDTARALLVNADYLSNRFHKEMGLTFTDFVNRERIFQAATLLKRTTLQIQQISAAVGYNNASYFARQFTRWLGISPKQYRIQGSL